MGGSPQSSNTNTEIVPPQDVLDNQAIHTAKWSLYGLCSAMTYSDNILKWLAAHRLIKNSRYCVPCNEEYSLNVYNDGVDGFRQHCKGWKNVSDIPFRISMEELPPE